MEPSLPDRPKTEMRPGLRQIKETAWQVNGTPLSTVLCSPMWFRIFLLGILIASCARAQEGDKAGEEQRSLVPPERIPPSPPLAPEEALKTLRLQPGFRAELVAADPLVQNPIQIAFHPDGRIWVEGDRSEEHKPELTSR